MPVPLAVKPDTPAVAVAVHAKVAPATLDVNVTNEVLPPEQIVWVNGELVTVGVGLTITVAVIAAPTQVLAVGVILNVTVIGALVVFVKEPLILPLPLLAIPVTPGLSLVQLKVVPPTVPVIATVVIGFPEHIVCEAGVAVASGVGFTTIVAVPVTGFEQSAPL